MVLNLGLIITERCNIRCSHCLSDDFGDKNRRKDMSPGDIHYYIERTAAIAEKTHQPFSVSFSGGEPFLCYEDLLEGIRHAKQMGAGKISTVSNGFWGAEKDRAPGVAAELKEAGLSLVYFSLDDFHQEHVPLASVYHAVAACRHVGLAFGIKVSVTKRTSRLPEVLSGLGDLLLGLRVIVEEIPCVPEGRARDYIPREDLLCKEGIPAEPCAMGMMLVILPDGSTFPCCGTGGNESLFLGNAREVDFDVLYGRMKGRVLFKILRGDGPQYFVPYFERAGHSMEPHLYINSCELCQKVLTHPASGQVLPRAFHDWKVKYVQRKIMGDSLQGIER